MTTESARKKRTETRSSRLSLEGRPAPGTTKTVRVCVCVFVFVFIKLRISAQSDPVILSHAVPLEMVFPRGHR